MERKLQAMHKEYGIDVFHKCKDCCNFISGKYHGKTYSKCIAYGVSHSEATDWSGRFTACGLFGKDFETIKRKTVLDMLKRTKRGIGDYGVEGQISLF